MVEEFNYEQWLDNNEVDKDGFTNIYFPSDSFKKKEILKAEGFKFNKILKWHIAEVPEEFKDSVIRINIKDIAEINEDGVFFQEYAEDHINDLIKDKKGITSTWIGNKTERLRNIKATMIDLKFVNNDFYVVTFLSQNNNIFKWLTRSNVNEEYLSSSSLLITGTVKDHIIDKYENNAKVTLLSRVVIKEA